MSKEALAYIDNALEALAKFERKMDYAPNYERITSAEANSAIRELNKTYADTLRVLRNLVAEQQ